MSITDLMAGRMAPGRILGAPIFQAARRYRRDLLNFLARLPGLLRQSGQSLARLAGPSRPRLSPSAPVLRRIEARSHQAAIRALLRSEASATLVRLLAYLSTVAILGYSAAYLVRPAANLVPSAPLPVMEWRQVAKPFAAFALRMPELAESGYEYAMRRHVTGGGRQDILIWGALEGASPHLMVEIYRPQAERTGFGSAAQEIAARLQGLDNGSVKSAGAMETKFGTMSLVQFSLSEPQRQCLGFVHAYDDPRLQILGWHCSSGAMAVERETAACALDRLTLVAAGSEPKVRELFARAELRRNFCGQRSHLLAPTPKLGVGVFLTFLTLVYFSGRRPARNVR